MGLARVAVAAVLSLISLTVLSLHVALCVHYPSPLFAVTLLLNPSLWMFLGAAGMGCALALTYRERQRKVRAGFCASCHTRYGATMDSKWRTPEAQWRGGGALPQRGPSRAIYSYNGTSHKFYASYGTINEKQPPDLKRPSLLEAAKVVAKESQRDLDSRCRRTSPAREPTPPEAKPVPDGTAHKEEDEDPREEPADLRGGQERKNGGESPVPSDHKDLPVVENSDSAPGLPRALHDAQPHGSHVSHDLRAQPVKSSSICSSPADPSTPELAVGPSLEASDPSTPEPAVGPSLEASHKAKEDSRAPGTARHNSRPSCDCVARYVAMDYSRRRLYTTPGDGRLPRRHQYARSQVRSLGRYHKLLMHCKLKDPKDVPVELFAAKSRSTEDPYQNAASRETVNGDSGSDEVLPHLPSRVDVTHTHNVCRMLRGETPGVKSPQRANHVESDTNPVDAKSEGSEEGESVTLTTRFYTVGKVIENDSHYPPKAKLLPVKHSPPSPTYKPTMGQWSTASPPSAPTDSLPQQDLDQDPTHNSSQNPIQDLAEDSSQSPEAQCQDLDVASVSSESGLLPSCSKSSSVGRDFLKSPLWRSFRGGKKESKAPTHDDEEFSDEDNQRCEGDEPKSTRSQQHPGQQRLRSLFSSSRRAFTRPRRTRPSGGSERRAPWRASPASPSMSTSARDSPDSASPPGGKRTQPSASGVGKPKPKPKPKPPSTPPSPAGAVRSLVMRNIHKSAGRSREARRRLPHADADAEGGRPDGASGPEAPLSPPPSSTSTSPSPSVRPKERKKARTRLRGRCRAGNADSAMLLSDDTAE